MCKKDIIKRLRSLTPEPAQTLENRILQQTNSALAKLVKPQVIQQTWRKWCVQTSITLLAGMVLGVILTTQIVGKNSQTPNANANPDVDSNVIEIVNVNVEPETNITGKTSDICKAASALPSSSVSSFIHSIYPVRNFSSNVDIDILLERQIQRARRSSDSARYVYTPQQTFTKEDLETIQKNRDLQREFM
ncbi:MAG: hypothetical protein ACRC2T_17595 [Thermoguttaceae bacterium]